MRPLLHCFLGTILHLVVSLALGFGAFAFGVASFDGGGAKESKLLLKSLEVWHAPYAFFWKPVSEKFLPVVPPAREIPKEGDREGWRVYELHHKEYMRIAGIHTSVRNLGGLFSTLVGGCIIGSLYGFATRAKRQAKPTVDLKGTMNENTDKEAAPAARRPIFLALAIATCIGISLLSALLFAESEQAGPSGMGAGIMAVVSIIGGCLASPFFALIALLRREKPMLFALCCLIIPLAILPLFIKR